MIYVAFGLSFFGAGCCLAAVRLKKNNISLFTKAFAFALIAAFIVRYYSIDKGGFIYSGDGEINGLASLASLLSLSEPVTLFALFADWLSITAFLLTAMNAFFDIDVSKSLARYLVPVSIVLNLVFYKSVQTILSFGSLSGITPFSVALGIECGIELALVFFEWANFFLAGGYKNVSGKRALHTLGFMLLALVATMPNYFIVSTFGPLNMSRYPIDLSSTHRVFIYIAFIIPFALYFSLRNKTREFIRFTLIFISMACMITFSSVYSYKTITDISGWPFHLCVTAMFIVPLCLVFKLKKLFYFTYFINVLGAFLAMVAPNYGETLNTFSFTVVNFWVNHWCAFFFPLVCVALGEFDRPNKKSFALSMLWFLVYYVFVLFLNVFFTARGKNVDYFFINSDFIADKLGNWAEKLYNGTIKISLGGYDYVFHPLYQILFYLVYVAMGLGMWFLYELMFNVAAAHIELHEKLAKIRLDKYALTAALNGRSLAEPMDKDAGIKLQLKNFSKRYGANKHYAVHEANLEVNGGEIFGFLGPNGAGKSTIIKSIVGIQPISEGSISVCGYDCAKQSVEAKRVTGFVPDHYALYERLTGREYINYIADIYEVGKAERDERLSSYVKLFEMEKSIDNQIKTYSHGMKQKITIMSALIHEPKLWILDEPLTGLDPESIFQVKECMRRHAEKGNIVFFSSHIIDVVEKLCNRIAIIKGGVIQCVKTIEEVEEVCPLEEFYLKTIGNDDLIERENR